MSGQRVTPAIITTIPIIIGIAVAEIVLFVIVRYICIARNYLLVRLTGRGLERVHDEDGTGACSRAVVDYVDNDSLDESWEDAARPSMTSIRPARL